MMAYVDVIREAWAKASDEQRRKLALTLAAMVDKLEARPLAPPVILIPGEEWPTQEQIRKAVSTGAPVIHVRFVEAKDGHSLGT